MPAPKASALLHQAISLAQSGRVEDAHALLHKITSEDPTQEMAWLWLVQTESNPAQRIQILEECLRCNPNSEYAKKGLVNLRAQMRSKPPSPPAARAAVEPGRPKKSRRPGCAASGIWKIVSILLALAVLITLVAGGVVLYPKLKDRLPSLPLPTVIAAGDTLGTTRTVSAAAPSATASVTLSPTPSMTFTPTVTFTPSLTLTPTRSPIPSLYAGTPVDGQPVLYYIGGDVCSAYAVPISGGPQSLTTSIPDSCQYAKLSPDAARMTYLESQEEMILYVAKVDGSGEKTVFKFSNKANINRRIYWWDSSPDGKQVAASAPGLDGGPTTYIYLASSIGGGAMRPLKMSGMEEELMANPIWSPDSLWIFTWDYNKQSYTSYPTAIRVSDGRAVALTNQEDYPSLMADHAFSWSPDGKYITFLYSEKPETDAVPADTPANQPFLVEMGLDKTIQYIPLPALQGGYDPNFGVVWAPDGTSFLALSKQTLQLIHIGVDGQILSQGIRLAFDNVPVQWSPDGKWISVVAKERLGSHIGRLEIVRPDGSDFRVLADNAAVQPVVWK